MELKISVSEAANFFKEIQQAPDKIFEMIRADVKTAVSQYLSEMMELELSHFLGRERYERKAGRTNHRNGSYPRKFSIKDIGEVSVQIPRDRRGEYKSHVLPRCKRYEDALRQDLCMMFLTGISPSEFLYIMAFPSLRSRCSSTAGKQKPGCAAVR
ncbi:MAG: transposase [Desulfobacterales bacterium]